MYSSQQCVAIHIKPTVSLPPKCVYSKQTDPCGQEAYMLSKITLLFSAHACITLYKFNYISRSYDVTYVTLPSRQ